MRSPNRARGGVADAGLSVCLSQPGPIPLEARFTCRPGELTVLVGPSGSGKSTILRAIAGLYRPRSAMIACGAERWADDGAWVAPQARRAGMVFQHYALFPHLSAIGNVLMALGDAAPAERRGRAQALLDSVNLTGLEQRLPNELSGGQQQRVALARALAREPRVLLLDEPFSAVDQVTRRKLHRELAQLHARLNMPIVMVTHDLDEAAALADRLVVLSHGRTLQEGPAEEVLARPANAHVARLLDFRNLFDGVIERHDAAQATTWLRWSGRLLEARHQPSFEPGTTVAWGMLAENCILRRRDRPSRGEHENPLRGVIVELVRLGAATSISLQVGEPDQTLRLSIPTHLARRNALAVGDSAIVSLLKEGIHLMPR